MIYRIHKGKHRARPISLALWYDKRTMRRRVCFHTDCKYWLNGPDQQDVNKLFGIGYLPSHMQNSIRFGWRYDRESGKIELLTFMHTDGEQTFRSICQIRFNMWYRLSIQVFESYYEFTVADDNIGAPINTIRISKFHKHKWSYKLGPYFGGNQTAPSDMTIELKKL